jgi:PAS domain S-box-containing protein
MLMHNNPSMTSEAGELAARLAAIVASSDDAIVSKDLTGRITSWNAAAERMFGWTAEEIIGRPINIIIPPDRQAEEVYVLSRVSQGLGVDHFETVRQRKDGSPINVSLTISPIHASDGTVIGASKIARDISDRRLLEWQALRLAAIVASSDDAIVSKSVDGVIQTWNAGAERMFGFTAAEAVGRNISIIIPEDRLHEEAEVLRRIRAGESVEHFETVRRRKDGSFLDISLAVSPIRQGSEIIGASKIARDITEQRRLRKEAEEASRMKDEFLAMLSHELRTPLNTVVGYAAMLRKGTMEEPQRSKAVDVIHRNAQMLTRLVGELLDTSRIVTGKIRLDVRDCNLSALAHEAVENIRPSTDAKGVLLEAAIEPGVEIRGDRDRLRQVMWNLLTNAVKFTPVGGRINVGLSAGPSEVRFVVQDTGIGLTAEALPHIFQRFWQGEAGRSREQSGLGLGLALSRHFVELHGGRIGARSAGAGKGTEVWVELPRKMSVAAEAS